jgi:alpha-tubulin suppressor-like RCC1 family protein
MRARSLTAALALLAAACGDTLVDHRAGDLLLPEACDPAACPDPGISGAMPACVAGACGYACQGGLLKCSGGCCPATKIAAGEAHTCAIAGAPSQGELYCWGANESGQAAPDVLSAVYSQPRRVLTAVTDVALGAAHTCAIVQGAVHCWGAAADGRLGPGGRPVAANATAIAAGVAHTCAVVSGGVQCWGSNSADQRGGTEVIATPIPAGSGATIVAAGASHSCAVVGGAVRCWGSRSAGQLGDGSLVGSSAAPVAAGTLAEATTLVARGDHACAAVPTTGGQIDEALQCWGDAPGTPWVPADAQSVPAPPLRDPDRTIVSADVALLGAGRTHVCAKETGAGSAIMCFGKDNSAGQLGATLAVGEGRTEISITADATALAVGADHACAVLPGGVVRCWGANDRGQLGNGSTVLPAVGDLVPVSGL